MICKWGCNGTSGDVFKQKFHNDDGTKSDAKTKVAVERIKLQAQNLNPFSIIIDDKKINVNFKLALTMVDGKVCNSLSDTSSAQRCFICNCTSKDFNNIEFVLLKEINEEHLEFGISSLHAWIRFFECLLHVSYKLEVKT